MALAAAGTAVGIALSVLDSLLAPWITLASLLALIYSVHRYGREGADPPRRPRGRRRQVQNAGRA